ncbi:hydrogenase-4 component G [Poseidonibacter sp.]|uniref:hydrogenase-4 component G n=1 Tax=Poseidonibacter sp. TaxID=2321188 RepID=UPI003C769C48
MNVNLSNSQSINAYKQNTNSDIKADRMAEHQLKKDTKTEEKDLEKTLKDSAFSVQISMNAQIVLFTMDSSDLGKGNSLVQASLTNERKDVLNFLSGKEALNGLSLEKLGYEGKAITDLSEEEASALIAEDGFFGVEKTSQRISDFVFSFAGDDIELLKKGREGIVQGFEEANKLFGGELPEISYRTQDNALRLIDEKIASLQNPQESEE